jgi:hypothetical protein
MLILEKGMSRSVGWWSPGARERAGTEMETNAPRTTRASKRHALPLVRHGFLELREFARRRGHVARHGGRPDA